MLGLSEIASKASAVSKVTALYWWAEETVEVLGTEDDVMAWAANNIDSLVSPARVGG